MRGTVLYRASSFFKSSGYDMLKICFYKLIESIIQKICHGVKNAKKKCAIGETECNET